MKGGGGVTILLTVGGLHTGEAIPYQGKVTVTAGVTCAVDGVGMGPSVVLVTSDVSAPLCGVIILG